MDLFQRVLRVLNRGRIGVVAVLVMVVVAGACVPAAALAQTTFPSGSVQFSATPNPVARGGRLNYTAVVRNTGTSAIAGAYFEAEISRSEETLILDSVSTTRGTASVRSVFGETNNQVHVAFGRLEAGGSATIRFSTTIRADIPPALLSYERSAALFNTDSDGFPNTIARSDTLTINLKRVGAVTGFTLINARTDQPIGPLQNGATLRLGQLPPLNIRVNTTTGPIESMRITLNGAARVENEVPYAVCGDTNGNYNVCGDRLGVSTYTITATPFTANNAGGTAGAATTIRFTVQP